MVVRKQSVEEVCRLCQPFCAPAAFDSSFTQTKAGRLNRRTSMSSKEAKFWLRPEVYLAYNDGFGARALRELLALVEGNCKRIEKARNEFFG